MNTDVIDAEFQAPAIREEQAPALFGTTDPVESIAKMVVVADALKGILVGKKLVSAIQGREYVRVEGWQVLAGMLRLSAVTEWTRPVEGGWEARTVVYDPMGNTIGAGEGQCTRSEKTWASRDDYALRAMSQTRATSRALRNVLGFIVALAGYQATPYEEMPRDGAQPFKNAPSAPQAASTPVLATDEQTRAFKAACAAAGIASPGAWLVANVASDFASRATKVLTLDEHTAAMSALADELADQAAQKATTGGTQAQAERSGPGPVVEQPASLDEVGQATPPTADDAVRHDMDRAHRRALRLSVVTNAAKLWPDKKECAEKRHAAERLHRVPGLTDAMLDTVAVDALESLARDLEKRVNPPENPRDKKREPQDADDLLEYAHAKGLL